MVKKEETVNDVDKKNTDVKSKTDKKSVDKNNTSSSADVDKENLVNLVYDSVKNHKYSSDVISGAFSVNGLLDVYEEDYENLMQGVSIPKRLTITEFNTLINDYLNNNI